LSSNFSHGHSHLFWELIIRSIEDSEEMVDEDKIIYIISPWLRDIEISSSGVPSEDFRDLLDGYSGPLSKLSDVFIAMKETLNYKINILTLDSTDKLLPKTERPWLDLESTMMDKLVGFDKSNPKINVWKQLGVHAKMYIFPSATLIGSVNLTNAGLFLNGENLTLVEKQTNPVAYRQVCINGQSQMSGAISYHDGAQLELQTQIISDEEPSNREIVKLEPIKSNFPNPNRNADAYVVPPKIQMGGIPNIGSHFLNIIERNELHKWCYRFEEEMRSIVKYYYHEFAKTMNDWNIEDTDKPLKDNWHKLLIVKSHGESLHDSAVKTIGMSKWKDSDFPSGKMLDLSNLSPDEALIYGTVLNDLWTCIYGSENKPFTDHSGTDLTNKSLYFFTTQVLDLPAKQTNQAKLEKFWNKLEDYFWAIKWVRDRHGHVNEIPRTRAIECQTALIKFNERVLKPFSQYYS